MTTSFITPRWCITAAALIVTAILLSPFYWVLVGSFMTPAELFSGHLWPKHLAVENWSDALSRLWPHIQNSLLVSAVACIGTPLARKRPYGGSGRVVYRRSQPLHRGGRHPRRDQMI